MRVRSPSLAVIFAHPGPAPVTTKGPDVERGGIGTLAGTATTCGFVLVSAATRIPADAPSSVTMPGAAPCSGTAYVATVRFVSCAASYATAPTPVSTHATAEAGARSERMDHR